MTWIPAPPSETLAATLAKGNATGGLDISFTAGDKITGTGEILAETVAGFNIRLATPTGAGEEVEVDSTAIRGLATCYGVFIDNNYAEIQAGPTGAEPHHISMRCHRADNEIQLTGSNIGDGFAVTVPAEMFIRPGINARTSGTHNGADLNITAGPVGNAGNAGDGGALNIDAAAAPGAGRQGHINIGTNTGGGGSSKVIIGEAARYTYCYSNFTYFYADDAFLGVGNASGGGSPEIRINGATATLNGGEAGGAFEIFGSNVGGSSPVPATLTVHAGDNAGTVNGPGADLTLRGGNSTDVGVSEDGGDVAVNGGTAAGSGSKGAVTVDGRRVLLDASGNLGLGDGLGAVNVTLDKAAGERADIRVQNAGVLRWETRASSAADPAIQFRRFNSSGVLQDTPLQLGGGGEVGFFDSTGTTQPTITGSRAGNAALADFLTKMASMGLIVDGSSA